MELSAFPWMDRESSSRETIPLKNVFLHTTKACNLKCSYCYFSAHKPLPDEMTTEEFTTLWPTLVRIRPEKVIFTGGEPLLRADILDLLRGLRDADPEHRILRCLNSNGHLVTPQFSRAVVDLADEVRVSLDAFSERNDSLRGPGNFEAAVQALNYYRDAGFEPKVLVTVTAESLPDLEEFLCFLVERKITRININLFRPIGRGRGHWEWQPNPAKIREATLRAWERCYPGQPLTLPAIPAKGIPQHHCGVGSFINIMPNGDVFPCHVLTDREFCSGNVREQSLLEICQKNGLLGRLANLDFAELADQDERVAELIQSHACLGYIYAQTKSRAVWRNTLPLSPSAQVKETSSFQYRGKMMGSSESSE